MNMQSWEDQVIILLNKLNVPYTQQTEWTFSDTLVLIFFLYK